jgi:N-methylhydantoinase A/oxoprolinase/acetone carboxylase beta subunit
VNVWDREKLFAGDRFEGPAVIEQFDSTTVALAGQMVTVESTGTLVIEERGAA